MKKRPHLPTFCLAVGLLLLTVSCDQEKEPELQALRARVAAVETESAELRKEVTRLEARVAEQSSQMSSLSHTHPLTPEAPWAGAAAAPTPKAAPVVAREAAGQPEPVAQDARRSGPRVAVPRTQDEQGGTPEEPSVAPVQGPGVWEADEPFMRVGSREGYVEVTEYVEELPMILTRWLRGFVREAGMSREQAQAVAAALTPSVDRLQELGRSYLQGEVGNDALRSGFWAEFAAAEIRVGKVLGEADLTVLKQKAVSAIANDDFLPALLGEAPTQ